MKGPAPDRRLAIESLEALWKRLPAGAVEQVCTAHAHCQPFDEDFITAVAR